MFATLSVLAITNLLRATVLSLSHRGYNRTSSARGCTRLQSDLPMDAAGAAHCCPNPHRRFRGEASHERPAATAHASCPAAVELAPVWLRQQGNLSLVLVHRECACWASDAAACGELQDRSPSANFVPAGLAMSTFPDNVTNATITANAVRSQVTDKMSAACTAPAAAYLIILSTNLDTTAYNAGSVVVLLTS